MPSTKEIPFPDKAPSQRDKGLHEVSSVSSDLLFDMDMSGVLRLRSNAANESGLDSIVLSGKSEIAMRRLIAEFGFPRLPYTAAEFYGMLEYCQELDTASGFNMTPAGSPSRAFWRSASIDNYCKYYPKHETAVRLYCAGEREALLAHHTSNHTIEELAKDYLEFDSESHD